MKDSRNGAARWSEQLRKQREAQRELEKQKAEDARFTKEAIKRERDEARQRAEEDRHRFAQFHREEIRECEAQRHQMQKERLRNQRNRHHSNGNSFER